MATYEMNKGQMKSKAGKCLDANVRSLSSYLKDCARLLKGGRGMIMSDEQRAAYKLLKGATGLKPEDCNLGFIKSFIPTDEEGRLCKFVKVGDNLEEWCIKKGIDQNDKQFTTIEGKDGAKILVYREVRTTWTGSQIINLLVKAADARAKANKQ
jgi:hypothetical protein